MANTFNIEDFREHFPEFADDDVYTEGQIEFWYSLALNLLNADRWGDLYTFGLELLVAHNIAIARANANAGASVGGVPGQGIGLISNQSAGSVNVGMDTGRSTEENGGNYNLTTYGTQYLRLARIVGIGGVQLY